MVIIDSQVHAYEANTPKRPWHSVPNWPAHVTGDEKVAAMDKVGVDGAIYISPFSMYQYDGTYDGLGATGPPRQVRLVKPVNPDDPAVADLIPDCQAIAANARPPDIRFIGGGLGRWYRRFADSPLEGSGSNSRSRCDG